MLEQINSPQDLKKLNEKEKKQLAEEIRKYILDVVSENGGHLASNLGVVELTIALHSVFNVPEDKIVWDVGHQSYVHKIITGRREELKNIRKLNGIAGFPKSNESDADCFNTGHSSTSISAVLGMARARDLQGKKNSCIAVIGDGALTGGMALEALNDAGCSNCNLTVILNDNEMSIAKNIGGINQFLSTLRTKKLYTRTNRLIKNKLNKLPVVGNKLVRIIQRFKRACKQLVIRGMYFEDIGFTYLGPVDGHNIEKLESILKLSKEIEGPVLIHVLTKKGKGYKIAEKNPDRFHATSPFNIETGELKKEKKADYSKIFGEKLVKLARENEKIVAVTASMKDGTGLREFQKEFPKRFFDMGIAEQDMMSTAAGLATCGKIPYASTFAIFAAGRAYDQIRNSISYPKLNVKICATHAGITVGEDGATHQMIEDISLMRTIPNMTVISVSDDTQTKWAVKEISKIEGPVYLRLSRLATPIIYDKNYKFEIGKAIQLGEGTDATICSTAKETKKLISIEDHNTIGGLGSAISEVLTEIYPKQLIRMGIPDTFGKSGKAEELMKYFKITAEDIVEKMIEI